MSSASKRKSLGSGPTTSRQKVRAHRERLRAQGLRPIQVWVPDTRSPKFAKEASRQSRLVASSRFMSAGQSRNLK
jgi:hypothetical protein